MTPAIQLLQKRKITHSVHQYEHDPRAESYGQEAADLLGVPAERVFKTLVVSLNSGQLAVGILPVNKMLSPKLLAKKLGAKKASMADKVEVSKVTGYVLGGVSPLGQKNALATVIDESALQKNNIYVSAGRRGLDVELSAKDLAELCNAHFAKITQD